MEKSRLRISRAQDTLICLLILLSSGWAIVRENIPNEILWPILVPIFACLMYFQRGRFTKRSVGIWLFFGVLVLIQIIWYWDINAKASVGFLVMLTCALLAANSCQAFRKTYISLLSVVAAISLAFFFLQQVGVLSGAQFAWLPGSGLPDGSVHAWVYNFHSKHIHRNCGPFWEPGVFAGYLLIALLFLISEGKDASRVKTVLVVIALMTTLSTTGYLALIPTAVFWLLTSSSTLRLPFRIAGISAGVVVAAIASAIAISQVPFLGEKIAEQYEDVLLQNEAFQKTRLGAAVYDWEFIRQRPIIGWTPSEKSRQSVDASFVESYEGAGNGFTGFAASFGVPALTLFLWGVFESARIDGQTRGQAAVFLVVIMALLQGEQFLDMPLFWCLAMLRAGSQEEVEVESMTQSVT